MEHIRRSDKLFLLKIVVPTILTIGFFIVTIFAIVIPTFEKNSLNHKRELIRRLTESAWSILARYDQAVAQGELPLDEAQQQAITDIRNLRYGEDGKDYFWINDREPRMIMHPYRPELEGQDLSDYQDRKGKRLFVAFVDVVAEKGQGYVDYTWQWKDDPKRDVPKLSFVKEFAPWGWIIGTGIYIEDVREEIALLTNRLIRISLIITGIIFILLVFITLQSFHIERQRQHAEADLRESREKYRTLVEATTECTAMILDDRFAFSNQKIQDLLGYSAAELSVMTIGDILPDTLAEDENEERHLRAFLRGETVPSQFEAQLKHKQGHHIDVMLALSRINIAGKQGIIVIGKDMSPHKEMEAELGQQRQQYAQLTNAINIGVFRAAAGRHSKLIQANPAALSILGIESETDIETVDLLEFFHDAEDRESFIRTLLKQGHIKNKVIQLQKPDGSAPAVLLSAVAVSGDDGAPQFYDGIIEDITEQKRTEEARENLISELQSSLLFLNEPISHFMHDMITCDLNTPIAQAAAIMTKKNFSAILVASDSQEVLGIITDHDLRQRIIGKAGDINQPAYTVMSSPMITISDSALIFEAILLMQEYEIQHLAVKDHAGKIAGIVRNRDLLQLHRYSSAFMFREIHAAATVDAVIDTHQRQPQLVKGLIESGAKPRNITRIITAASDSITQKYIDFAIAELGTPPAEFTFMALGSQGREEQTLVSDQDNAIIYYSSNPEQEEQAKQYFLKLGEKVCDWLYQTGYEYCNGEVMAKNPKWCMSLAHWREQFRQWVAVAAPQDFREFNIFFDFRSIYGDKNLCVQLREHIYDLLRNNAPFFMHFAMDALHYKPPIGMFGKLVLESSSSESPHTFDIKEAMLPIVNFARLYALKNGIYETNTLERLHKLYEKNILKKSDHQETILSYNYLMQLRVKHQSRALSEGADADNNIDAKTMSHLDETTLKQAFHQISALQKRISIDFTGGA